MIKDLSGALKMNVNQLSGLLRSVFFFLGFCPGLVVALSFISGDEQGRVNLLYLLILFVFLPVCGIMIRGLALFLPWGKGVVRWLLEFQFWPQQWAATNVCHTWGTCPARRIILCFPNFSRIAWP